MSSGSTRDPGEMIHAQSAGRTDRLSALLLEGVPHEELRATTALLWMLRENLSLDKEMLQDVIRRKCKA